MRNGNGANLKPADGHPDRTLVGNLAALVILILLREQARSGALIAKAGQAVAWPNFRLLTVVRKEADRSLADRTSAVDRADLSFVHLPYGFFLLVACFANGRLSRAPGPALPSSIISIPAFSRALWIAAAFAKVIAVSPSTASAR